MTLLLALLLSAPCATSLTLTQVPAQGAPATSGSAEKGLGQARLPGESTNPGEFSGMVGSTFVTLSGDQQLSGWKIDLLHPRWQRMPTLDRGRWSADGGLADQELVAGGRLLAVWWRGKTPIRVAVYDPDKNAWERPPAAAPNKASYTSGVALKDWWLAEGGFRFHPVKLAWSAMKASPLAGFSISWPSAASGNNAYFFSPEDGSSAVYDADADRWTKLPSGGPQHPYQAHVSPRTGRVAVLAANEGVRSAPSGAVYDPAAKAWTPISGDDEVGLNEQPTPVGPYLAAFFNPGDPIWLLDIDAARWKPVPEPPFPPVRQELPVAVGPPGGPIGPRPPRPAPASLVLAAGGETIFITNPDCLGDACLATGHVGSGRLQVYDPDQGRWCVANFPPAVGHALGAEQYFRYEVLWRNHLLLWEASSSQDDNTGGIPWSADRTRSRSALRGGVLNW
ncbi:MAG TPA: hypothetical protein VFA20_33650 [Myxococcaceae bacterium]|nr:hypothetical protein [Myxococcaceae bacterium]